MEASHLEEALRASEELNRRLIESSCDCIKVLDLDGRLVFMSAGGVAALEICDLRSVIGSPWIDFWEGQDREHAKTAVTEARRGGIGRFTGYFPTTQTKQPRWWDVVVTAICDKDGNPAKLLAISRDVTELKEAEQTLRQSHEKLEHTLLTRSRELAETGTILQDIVESLESKVGEQFFPLLVQQLATVLGVDYAYISELSEDGTQFRSKAGWGKGKMLPPFDVPARGPCETVLTRKCVHHPDQLQALYPHVQLIQDIGVESYCGVPVVNSAERVLGHLAIMDSKPMPDQIRVMWILGVFATRAAAEFERLAMEARVQRGASLLRQMEEGTSSALGEQFFQSLTKTVAAALGVPYVFVSEVIVPDRRVRTLAFWAADRFADTVEYDLEGTPCQRVLLGEVCHYEKDIQTLFPRDLDLVKLHAESYMAVPLVNQNGKVLGHLAALDTKRMPLSADELSIFKIFGSRAGTELGRRQMEAVLKRQEEDLQDLFDEAPIAYVHEGVDSKFIRANRTAMKTLGITPDQVEGTYGFSFIPDTPEAQGRLKEAFDSIGKGIDTSGVVLELRRKDNGKPLWIKWWSRPDPSGAYTRTMFVDITEQMLMEQEKARLEAQNVYLREEIKGTHNFEEVIGSSSSLKNVLKHVERVAPTDSTVLITGETGTGKELIARAIHNLSPRKERPLVKVNCAAIPAGLIESELFGHEKGAFTGALTRKIGRFELADKGTIFLDEIGDLPLDLQSKLLRVLQEGEFERVGSSQTHKVNVRVIAATNRDLAQLSRIGQYRADLYYRLNVFPVHMPPLRERDGDLPLLVQYFVQKYAAAQGKQIERLPDRLWTSLKRYHWPGNIRELEHVIERAVILTEGPELAVVDWLSTPSQMGDRGQLPTLEELERDHIVQALNHTDWRVSGPKGAAAILGLKPTTLEARMKKLGIARTKRDT